MKKLLQGEQVMQLILAIVALNYQTLHFCWWQWVLLFFSPDISMLGYLINTKVGAVCYNIAHHKAIAGVFIIIGFMYHMPIVLFVGMLLWAHSAFDRVMGYGLKYADSFDHTHLGMIGKSKKTIL
ncbi:MAG: DUF4260 domain-containing protein [Bacteroidota bacterium]